MNTHEVTVYGYHLSFLKDFPELNSWLNCNGYTIVHSHQDFPSHVIYTSWDDHSAEAEKNNVNDAKNSVMIAYCQTTKTVEVFQRVLVADTSDEKELLTALDAGAAAMRDALENAGRNPDDVADEIEKMIQDIKRQQ